MAKALDINPIPVDERLAKEISDLLVKNKCYLSPKLEMTNQGYKFSVSIEKQSPQ